MYSIVNTTRGFLTSLCKLKALHGFLLVLFTCLWCTSASAFGFGSDNTFKTEFFRVELEDGWKVQGRPQNSERALNVNFVNSKLNIRINVVVGAAKVTVPEQLRQLQAAIRNQGGVANQVRSRNGISYFTFTLGTWPGFCYAGSDGKDLAVITSIGNRHDAATFIRSFTHRHEGLFPSF